jgi:hypothetical protein
VETGVIGLDLDGLKVDVVVTRDRGTEGVNVALFCNVDRGFTDFTGRLGFCADWSCRSLASLRLSLVLLARLYDGVCVGMVFAVGGVVTPVN